MARFIEISIEDTTPLTWHFKCLNCSRFFRTQENLVNHEESLITCPHCQTKLNNFKSVHKDFLRHSLYIPKLVYEV